VESRCAITTTVRPAMSLRSALRTWAWLVSSRAEVASSSSRSEGR
jgi:hypothetical protein